MSHLSSLVIDALAAGRLDESEADAARAHIAECARCSADLAATTAAMEHFERSVLPRTLPALSARRRWWVFVPAMLVPVVAALALVLWLRAPEPRDDVRIKGGFTFQVFANHHGEIIPVRDGTLLAPGDSIRFVVGSGGAPYVMVVSIDGAGYPSIYYPYGGARSGSATSDPSELPGSIVLDASPGPERVFALVSWEPLEADEVKQALAKIGGPDEIRKNHALVLPVVVQTSVLFEKAAP